uniref:Uncharacterized protein n=1 Tax=Populus alba TaxID=43335 RepID=A0A4U5NNJ0_POPAL|nr:hypothetical protein D5086_0000250310 [Populus alba]
MTGLGWSMVVTVEGTAEEEAAEGGASALIWSFAVIGKGEGAGVRVLEKMAMVTGATPGDGVLGAGERTGKVKGKGDKEGCVGKMRSWLRVRLVWVEKNQVGEGASCFGEDPKERDGAACFGEARGWGSWSG